MIALVNGRPKLINLKSTYPLLRTPKTVVRRRTEYNLKKQETVPIF